MKKRLTREEQAAKMIEEHLRDKNVLEIACGRGLFSLAASETAKNVVCIDLDAFRLDDSVRACGSVKFKQMDATALQYDDGTFDTVVMYNAAAHLESVFPAVLRESLRVLKPGGHVFLLSSFSMDKGMIQERLPAVFEAENVHVMLRSDKTFLCADVWRE